MKALSCQINLLEPLLATQLGAGEENSSQSFGFIPGSMLRGVLVNLYLQERKRHKQEVLDPAQDPVCRRLFFDGATLFLNAYPVDRNGRRALPKPLSWYMQKEEIECDSGTIYDFAVKTRRYDGRKAIPGDFCWLYGDEAALIKTGSILAMHNASEERMARSRDRSTVYRYEAIAAGQVFGAVILSENDDDLELLRTMIDGAETYMGGSRSAGYGRVAFKETRISSAWREYEQDFEHKEGLIILTLLSDLILRDNNGQFTTDLDEITGCKHIRHYGTVKVVGGFNRKWGLPLVQAPALQAGSVFVYPAGGIDGATLRKYLAEGIGERRVEGFGRIAVNLHRQETLKKIMPEQVSSPRCNEPLSEESRKLAHIVAARRLKNMLDQKLLEAVDGLSIKEAPENAQLNRLREVARQAWYKEKPEIISSHLKNLKAAGEQFKRARVEKRSFFGWLQDGIEQEKIWSDYLEVHTPRIAGVKAEITKKIKLEYTVRLLEALLKKTVKEGSEGGVS